MRITNAEPKKFEFEELLTEYRVRIAVNIAE